MNKIKIMFYVNHPTSQHINNTNVCSQSPGRKKKCQCGGNHGKYDLAGAFLPFTFTKCSPLLLL